MSFVSKTAKHVRDILLKERKSLERMIIVDGCRGGGQLLRTALSLSTATGKAFEMKNIRGQREEKGLKAQHLTAVHAIQKICQAEVVGDMIKSTQLRFIPHQIKGGNYRFVIGTAGSIPLVLQTLIPAAFRGEHQSTIEVIGGTNVPLSPPSFYFKDVFCDFLKRMGVEIECTIERFGFYPQGGGKMVITVKPCKELKSITFTDRGKRKKMHLAAYASRTLNERKVTQRMIASFQDQITLPFDIEERYVDTFSPGCFLHSCIEYENYKVGDDVLGEPKKRSEELGEEAVEKVMSLIRQDSADYYTADQLLLYMGLKGEGKIKVMEVTDHVRTNAKVIEQFLPVKFDMRGNMIVCRKL